MITKSAWHAVSEQLMAGGHERADQPTADELLAYKRGELSLQDDERVREQIASDPELARLVAEPFPADGAEPGDPDYLTDAEFAEHWAVIRRKMKPPQSVEGRVLNFWTISTGIAAALAITFGVLLWQVRASVTRPQIWEEQVLLPDGRRGVDHGPAILTAKSESVILIAPLIGDHDFDRYQIEIVSLEQQRTIWRGDAPRPQEDNAFAVVVPRRFLTAGTYRLVIHGVSIEGGRPLASYSVRVPG